MTLETTQEVMFGNGGDEITVTGKTLAEVAADLQDILCRTGEYDGPVDGKFDEKTHQALRSLVGKENLEERWDGKGDVIDRKVVDYLKERFADKS